MATSRIGNTDLISELNSRLVLHAVRVMQPTFRAQVSRSTGLKPATITSIVNNLIDQKLLRETPGNAETNTRFGRPPLLLEVNRDFKRILAIDLEPDQIRVALTDVLARILDYREQKIDRFDRPESILAQIIKLCRTVTGNLPTGQLQGVGLSLPGLIDREKGILHSSTNMPKWKDVSVGPWLEKELKVPVKVDRSIHLAALYEKWTHPESLTRKMIVISLRTGIGMSLLQDGHLYVGSGGLSGEIGHTIVDINGKPCDCGSSGCLETFVGAPAIVARAHELIKAGRAKALAERIASGALLTPELIYTLARDGDADCIAMVRTIGHYLGIAISNLINLLGPDEVVVCGAIDEAEAPLLEAIREQIDTSALPRLRASAQVRVAAEHEKVALLGAAVLISQDIFELPSLRHSDRVIASPKATPRL
jgi:predicted NBD/HSP70 family sugar kinase